MTHGGFRVCGFKKLFRLTQRPVYILIHPFLGARS